MKYITTFLAVLVCSALFAAGELTVKSETPYEHHWQNCVDFFSGSFGRWLLEQVPKIKKMQHDIIDEYNRYLKSDQPGCVVESATLSFKINNGKTEKIMHGIDNLEAAVEEQFGLEGNRALVVLTHDWLRDSEYEPMKKLVNALFVLAKKNNVNLVTLTIDWNQYSGGVLYLDVLDCIEPIGKIVAGALKDILGNKKNKIAKAAIGHGMGAHIVGHMGKQVKFQYILALDPTGLCLPIENVDGRLNERDAEFVEALHTTGIMGFSSPVAKHDHYVHEIFLAQGNCHFWDVECGHSKALDYTTAAIELSLAQKKKTSLTYLCKYTVPMTFNSVCWDYEGFMNYITYEYPSYLEHVMTSEGMPIDRSLVPREGKYFTGQKTDKNSAFSI